MSCEVLVKTSFFVSIQIDEPTKITQLPLDFDEKTKEVLVEVHPNLCKKLKPHQVNGIKFMWDVVFESKKVSV